MTVLKTVSYSSKNDFWPFLKSQKMDLGQKKFREIDLFDFTSFFGLDFFNFAEIEKEFN